MKAALFGLLFLAAFIVPTVALALIWFLLPAFVALGVLLILVAYYIGEAYLDYRKESR